MKTVKEVSRMSGVSIRALHHYDAIGLLPPSGVTEAGYRQYDGAALRRLQLILLYRELGFPLDEIKRLLDSPTFHRRDALAQLAEMLRFKRERLDALIALACGLQASGDEADGRMPDFSAFDRHGLDHCITDALQRDDRTPSSDGHAQAGTDGDAAFMAQFAALGRLKSLPPEDATVQRQVERLRGYISANYYACTLDVFECLAGLYASGRFTDSIDAAGGEGTAAFAAAAISAYCRAAGRGR